MLKIKLSSVSLHLQSALNISNSEGTDANVRDSRSLRYQEMGLKRKKSYLDPNESS